MKTRTTTPGAARFSGPRRRPLARILFFVSAPDPKSSTWKAWFAHAFAVEKPGEFAPTPEQCEIVDRLCREVVKRGLSTPATMALEMSRPLNMLGASAMHMLQPIIATVMNGESAKQFANFLEHRGSIDHLCARIDLFETESRRNSADGE